MRLDKVIDQAAFIEARARAVEKSVDKNGIGTLGEKMLHRTLKYYFEPNDEFHEIEYLGCVVDIKNEQGVVEIQTSSFERLVPKLEKMLPETKVRIVYPIVENKKIRRINVETGVVSPPRKSTTRGYSWSILPELAKIARFIGQPSLEIVLIFVDAEETRMQGGVVKVGRRRTTKINCIPTSLNSVYTIGTADDCRCLIPDELACEFTAKDFEKKTKLRGIKAHTSLKMLMSFGLLTRKRESNKAYLYSVVK